MNLTLFGTSRRREFFGRFREHYFLEPQGENAININVFLTSSFWKVLAEIDVSMQKRYLLEFNFDT